jgi:hypothetical protein
MFDGAGPTLLLLGKEMFGLDASLPGRLIVVDRKPEEFRQD